MALTLTPVKNDLQGTVKVMYAQITLDSSYPTGGEAITLPFTTVYSAILETDDGYILKYDRTNAKILAYYADYDAVADGALIEVAATTDLSLVVIHAKFEGA